MNTCVLCTALTTAESRLVAIRSQAEKARTETQANTSTACALRKFSLGNAQVRRKLSLRLGVSESLGPSVRTGCCAYVQLFDTSAENTF